MNIFETLKELRKKESKDGNSCPVTGQTSSTRTSIKERKDPSYIYLDGNQIKEIPLSKLDSAGSALINRTMNYKNPARIIHGSIFHDS